LSSWDVLLSCDQCDDISAGSPDSVSPAMDRFLYTLSMSLGHPDAESRVVIEDDCVRALAHTCMIRVESLRPIRSDDTVSCTIWHI
jgi:hypothetical protein